mmetsp:Transcript_10697/g.19801  ORF Transcript_10697/g.19801 Transcript_10697/m.19801 type:complete len:897 (-) Transcript_10697:61-2751(-)
MASFHGDALEEGDEDLSVLVANLVSAEEALVPTLRSVVERRWSDRFGASLDQFLVAKESELRQLCNLHFDEFSDGVVDISKLKESAQDLTLRLKDLDAKLQDQGKRTLESTKSLLRFHRMQRHLNQAKGELSKALNLVSLVHRTKKLVGSKAYFEALQTIDLVREVVQDQDVRLLWTKRSSDTTQKNSQDHSLSTQSGKSRLMKGLEAWVPLALSRIKFEVNRDLTDWFVAAREQSGPIGAAALEIVAKRQRQAIESFTRNDSSGLEGKESSESDRKTIKKGDVGRASRSRASSDAILAWEHRDPSNTINIAEMVLAQKLALTPVSQYIDLQQYLGDTEHAIQYYKQNRLPQTSLQALIPVDVDRLTPGHFAVHVLPLLERLTGFFLIEASLSRTLSLVSPYELGKLWETLLDELLPVLQGELRATVHDDIELRLRLVEHVINLSQLLGRFGDGPSRGGDSSTVDLVQSVNSGSSKLLDTTRLVNLCVSERQYISQLLVQDGSEALKEILGEEKCIPLCLDSSDSPHAAAVATFGLAGLDIDHEVESKVEMEFPATFKFSDTVVKVGERLFQLVDKTFTIARQLGGSLNPSSTSISSTSSFVSAARTAARVTDLALGHLNEEYGKVIKSGNTPAEALCQYSVNLWFLSRLQPALGEHLQALAQLTPDEVNSGSKGGKKSASRQWWELESLRDMAAMSEEAQNQVTEAICGKIDDLMAGGISVDWTPEEMTEEPHWFVSDTVQYLSVAFGPNSALRLLPQAKLQAIYFVSFGRISEAMLDLLTGPRIPEINALSVYALSKDLEQLLGFCQTSNVPGLDETFATMQQFVSLLVSGDLEGYVDVDTRNRRYPYIRPVSMVSSVLKKYRQIKGSVRMLSTKCVVIKDSDVRRTIQILDSS